VRESSPYLLQRSASVPQPSSNADVYPFAEQPTFPEEDDFELRRYWNVIRRHYRLILTLFLIAEIATCAFLLTRTPQYTAVSTILVERQAPQLLSSTATSDQSDIAGVDTFYKTQYQILKSRSIAARVILDLRLEKNKYLNGPGSEPSLWTAWINWLTSAGSSPRLDHESQLLRVPGRTIDSYLADLTIRPEYDTRLVEIAFTSPDPVFSAKIANAHVRAYILQGYQRHAQSSEEAQRFLERKLGELEKRIEKSEADLNEYRRERGLVSFSLDDKDQIVSDQLMLLNRDLVGAEAERIALQADVQTIQNNDYNALPAVANSTLIQNLKAQLTMLQGQYASLSNQFTSDFPKVAELRAQVAELNRREQHEIDEVVNSTREKYQSAVDRENELRREFEQEKAHAMSLKGASLKEVILAREVDTNRALYQSVLERIKVLGMTTESQMTNISVIDPAEVPLVPSSPKKKLDMVLSGFLSLLLGVAAAFLIAGTDNTLKSSDEVQRYLRLPNLATVPHVAGPQDRSIDLRSLLSLRWKNDRQSGVAANPLEPMRKSFAAVAEAYRAVRTGILLSRSEQPPKTILVSSSTGGEGKSLTAINSAIVFAQMLNRVLLIDADLRWPRCHEILKVSAGPGLTEVLTGSERFDDAVQPTAVNGLYLLSAGVLPPNPTELLASKKMAEILTIAASYYEQVLIDSPPLLPVSDSVVLSRLVDGVVLVVSGNTARPLVRGSCSRLLQVGAKILGVVLNNVEEHEQHYYKGSYYTAKT
jgi:polysaccharide biosynthesis transport protein